VSATIGLDRSFVSEEIRRFLREDIGSGDITTEWCLPPGTRASGAIVARDACVVAGLPLAQAVFHELDGGVMAEPLVADGTAVAAGTRVLRLDGPAAAILSGERLALNLVQRLSGIATVTRRYAAAVDGTGASVSDTRKTTPGLRAFEKYAVRVGGGRNHRVGLFDAVLIKDNHVAAAGGVAAALRAVDARRDRDVVVEVEVDSLEQLAEALDAGARAVLLDNLSPEATARAVAMVRSRPGGTGIWIESSGGVTLHNVRDYALAGVDTVSVGALTHSAPSVDLGLDFDEGGTPARHD
jgi:nicotinate-nucleotide pyrophosphorylase (carboxylating)